MEVQSDATMHNHSGMSGDTCHTLIDNVLNKSVNNVSNRCVSNHDGSDKMAQTAYNHEQCVQINNADCIGNTSAPTDVCDTCTTSATGEPQHVRLDIHNVNNTSDQIICETHAESCRPKHKHVEPCDVSKSATVNDQETMHINPDEGLRCTGNQKHSDDLINELAHTHISQIAVEPCASTLQDHQTVLRANHSNLVDITYDVYESELQMPDIMTLITKDLSEPYSIYTYRYFIHNWPKLCFLATSDEQCVGAIVCKLDLHKKVIRRGYIAMLAIDENYRRQGIGSRLVMKAIQAMVQDDCDEVVLETEITNKAALRLYENLGFVRDKRLFRYYLNGVDALRLKLWLR